MRELFVYYRVPVEAATAALAEVRDLQADLRAANPGLVVRLLRRPAQTGGTETWMETYAIESVVDPAGVSAALESAIEAQAARRLTCIEGPRHVEVFLACAS